MILTEERASQLDALSASIERLQRAQMEKMEEVVFGNSADQRVADLRASILGPQPAPRLMGLSAFLDREAAK